MSGKLRFVFVTSVLTAGAALLACAGSGDDGSTGAAGALESGKAPSASSEAGAPSSLQVTGDSFTIAEAVLIHDQTLNDDGSQTPTARIIFSNRTGTCDRLDQGLTLAPDEKSFSVRVKQPTFTAGKVTFTSDTKTNACVYIDNDLVCDPDGGGASPTGTGTLDVKTVVTNKLTGSIDITVGSRRLQGSFSATACPDGKITDNRVNCGLVEEPSTDEENEAGADDPAYGTPPAPSSTASR